MRSKAYQVIATYYLNQQSNIMLVFTITYTTMVLYLPLLHISVSSVSIHISVIHILSTLQSYHKSRKSSGLRDVVPKVVRSKVYIQ